MIHRSRPPQVAISPIRLGKRLALWAAVMATAAAGQSQITNPSFETGDLTGWVAGGSSQVEVLRSSNFSTPIAAPAGTYFVLLSSGPGDPGGPTGYVDGNLTLEYNIATLTQTFNTTQPGEYVSFLWGFLTSEANQPSGFDDVFWVRIDGTTVLSGSVRKNSGSGSTFPDTPAYDGNGYVVSSTGPTNGSDFAETGTDGFTGFFSFLTTIASAGSHTIEFLVADQADTAYDSGLVVDNVRVGPPAFNPVQVTHTSGSSTESKGGGIVYTPHQSRGPAVSNDGIVVGLVSTGDFGTGNPTAQDQVFAVTSPSGSYAFERLTSMADGTASRPSLSANGEWIAYSAVEDAASGVLPVNTDPNREVFLRHRPSKHTIHLTATSECSNTAPSVNDTGTRVAFQSNCSFLTLDPDTATVDTSVMVWNNGPYLRLPTIDGCTSRSPEIAANGTQVAFVSSCDHTGSNPDGNLEIFRWALGTGAVTQVTTSTTTDQNDSVDIGGAGDRIVFVSSADYDASVGNADGNYEIFLWDGGAFTQLTDTAATIPGLPPIHLTARISNAGGFVVGEVLDTLTGANEVFFIDRVSDTRNFVAAGDVRLPDVGVDDSVSPPEAVVVFESTEDFTGENADGNLEVFSSRRVVPKEPATYCSDPNLGIVVPDNSSRSHTITVSDTGTVTDVNVYLLIDHTRVNDVRAELSHGGVNNRDLIDQPQFPGGGPCTRDDIDATVDDEGTGGDVDLQCADPPPAVGSPPSYTPDQTLSAFDGTTVNGTWTLRVSDRVNNNPDEVATLQQWCLIISSD